MMRQTLLAVAATIWTFAACSGDPPVDIGDHVTGSKLSDYAGTWDGYAWYERSCTSEETELM